jgi:hypothetical protein
MPRSVDADSTRGVESVPAGCVCAPDCQVGVAGAIPDETEPRRKP